MHRIATDPDERSPGGITTRPRRGEGGRARIGDVMGHKHGPPFGRARRCQGAGRGEGGGTVHAINSANNA